MARDPEKAEKFQAHLQRGGIGLNEMKRLLEEFSKHQDLEKLKRQVFKENLLQKNSDSLVEALFSSFKRRFLKPLGLPEIAILAKAMTSIIPESGKKQILLPYFILSDPLVKKVYLELVIPRLKLSDSTITSQEIFNYFRILSTEHPELKSWSDYLQLRWARGFLTLLRRFDLMERYPSLKLKRLCLIPETFAFFWLWLWQQDGSFWQAKKNDLWNLLQTNDKEIVELLIDGHLKGWWIFQHIDKIIDFQPKFKTLEEWLNNAMA